MSENQCCMISDKTIYRSKYKMIRNSITRDLKFKKEEFIKNNLFAFLKNIDDIKTVFIYHSFGSEVDTKGIIEFFLENKITVLIPKCNEINETMYATVYNPQKKSTVNSYGISEMEESLPVNHKIDMIIAPGIAFDRFGNRIGFGKGYYDKFIKSLEYKTRIIALAFSEQIIQGSLPADKYDCKMDYIITDEGVINTN